MYAIQIKAIFIDYLLSKNKKIQIIASEVPILGGERFVDLIAIKNGAVHAFEIKGPRDSHARLKGQVKDLLGIADYVWLIIPDSQLRLITNKDYKNLGIITISHNKEIKIIKPSSRNTKQINYNMLTLFSKRDLIRIAKQNNISIKTAQNAFEIRLLLSKAINKKALTRIAKEHIQSKYQQRYRAFLKERGRKTTTDDIYLLQKDILNLKFKNTA